MKPHQDVSAPLSNIRCDFRKRSGIGSRTNALMTIALLGILFAVLSAPFNPAHALILRFDYTGNEFEFAEGPYTTSDRIMGYFVAEMPALENPLAAYSYNVIDYSFTDGVQTITPSSNPQFFPFIFATDSSGEITEWNIALFERSPREFNISTVNIMMPGDISETVFDAGSIDAHNVTILNDDECWVATVVLERSESFGCNTLRAGSFETTVVETIPLPATLPLFVSGLVGIALIEWKRRAST